MSIYDYSDFDHVLRRLNSTVHTLYIIADTLEELDDDDDHERRADLLILAENLIDVAAYVTEKARDYAWQHTPVPEHED